MSAPVSQEGRGDRWAQDQWLASDQGFTWQPLECRFSRVMECAKHCVIVTVLLGELAPPTQAIPTQVEDTGFPWLRAHAATSEERRPQNALRLEEELRNMGD